MEPVFLETAFKSYYDLEDEYIFFFEPASASSREAAAKSHDRIAARTTDKDVRVAEELWAYYGNFSEEFTRDPYDALTKMKENKIPILVVSPDHEVCFPPENWLELNRNLPTTQIIVIPPGRTRASSSISRNGSRLYPNIYQPQQIRRAGAIVHLTKKNHKTDFNFDAVTCYMQVSAPEGEAMDKPMLGVYTAFQVRSKDLSLPYKVK